MNYFFTADCHFDHKNIIKYCNRPYSDVDEMNEALINNWNSVVKIEDKVYHIGDFCLSNNYLKFRARLNGDIVFLNGSHDKEEWRENLLSIYIPNLKDEYNNKRLIVLCHYAMRSWEKSHYASWHLFGHHHGKLEPYGLSLDVGVDCNNYFPFSLYQIIEKMSNLKPIVDYRKDTLDKI